MILLKRKQSQTVIRTISALTLLLSASACSVFDAAPERGYPTYRSENQPYPRLMPQEIFEFDSNPSLEPMYDTEDTEMVGVISFE